MYFLSVLMVLSLLPDTPASTPDPVRVVSFNIRYDNARDGMHAWGFRRHRVAGILRFHRAEIFGLQEALGHQVADLERRFPEFRSFGIGRDPGGRGERCTIFYDARRFELVRDATFWLSPHPDRPGAAWGARLSRICTWGELKETRSGRRFFVFNTHFDHQSAEARKQSARLLLREIDEISGGAPVVLMGDFNCTPASVPYETLTRGIVEKDPEVNLALRDARDAAEDPPFGPPGTWSGFGPDAGHGARIDFVFTRGDLRVLRYGVIPHEWDGRPASDHRPVLADVVPHLAHRQLHVPLESAWRYRADPGKEGERLGLMKAGVDDHDWPLLHAGGPWESQGLEVDGVVWCRQWVHVPEAWREKTVRFVSEGIDDEFTLYLGGVEMIQLGKKRDSFWNRHVSVEIPGAHLKFGQPNLLVLRVVDHGGLGGLVGAPLRLTVAEIPSTHSASPGNPDEETGAKGPVPKRPRGVPGEAVHWNGNWYLFPEEKMHYPEAKKLAARFRAKVVVISSEAENAWVHSQIRGSTFLGIERDRDRWVIQERRVNFFFWDDGQPSAFPRELHVVIGLKASGRWHDVLAQEKHHVCLEWGKR